MEKHQTQPRVSDTPHTQQLHSGIDPVTRTILMVFVVAIFGVIFYFKPWKSFNDTTAVAASDVGDSVIGTSFRSEQGEATHSSVEALSKIMLLPEDDEPVIYAIENAQELIAQQAFFTGAQNGDTLIIFPKNQKAIIYSATRNVVVNAGPLSVGDNVSTKTID